MGVVCVCVVGSMGEPVRGLRHASMGEVEGRTVGRPKGEPPKLAWSRCKAKSLPRGWLGRKRSGEYILLHARHPMDLTPWCSWLSRQPNMLKVSGSNPDGVMFFSLSPSLSLSLSLSLSFSLFLSLALSFSLSLSLSLSLSFFFSFFVNVKGRLTRDIRGYVAFDFLIDFRKRLQKGFLGAAKVSKRK